MFTFHKPKVFRSANGCCICRAKSSSSRFTDSKRYEAYFEKCFGLLDEHRSGEICNACVLLVKRYIKLPAGSTRHWNHVVDARSGPGIKSMVKSKKQKDSNSNFDNSTKDTENETPEKINKKHFYRSKKKPAVVRKRNPSIPVSGFLDMSRWTKEKVCCGVIFRGPHGEVAIDPRFLIPCSTCKTLKEPLAPLPNTTNTDSPSEDMETDDSASVSSANEGQTSSSSAAGKLMEAEADDEGFFDKPAVSPSESGTSTPPPSSEPETLGSSTDESNFLRNSFVTT